VSYRKWLRYWQPNLCILTQFCQDLSPGNERNSQHQMGEPSIHSDPKSIQSSEIFICDNWFVLTFNDCIISYQLSSAHHIPAEPRQGEIGIRDPSN
jgi:hypothetical protein